MSQQNEQNFSPDMFSRLESVADYYSFAQPPHIEHRISDSGREIIRIDDTVAYPRGVDSDDPLADLILEPAEEKGQYLLPLNYLSFAHVFNEASGASTVDVGRASAADEVISNLMRRVGESIGAIAVADRLVPVEIDYNSMVIGRDDTIENKPRFVPPFELVVAPTNAVMIQKLRTATSSLNRQLQVAATPSQRPLVGMAMWTFREGIRSQTQQLGDFLK